MDNVRQTCSVIDGVDKIMSPVIVSASRSTDIPAFYADWTFMFSVSAFISISFTSSPLSFSLSVQSLLGMPVIRP